MRKIAILVMILTGFSMVMGLSKNSSKGNKKDPVYVVVNNGKVISAAGDSLLSEADFISVRVRHDTVFFTLKEDALKRLDADPARNYKQEKTKTTKQK